MTTEPDPRAYLETEARIIAEDDVDIVIAVRVGKHWIARNLPLLAALAELDVTAPSIAAEQE